MKSLDDSADNESDDASRDSKNEDEQEDDNSHSRTEEQDHSSKHTPPQSKLTKRHDTSKQVISRGSAATTAVSSSVTHNAATKVGKKKGAMHDRKYSKDTKPRKPYYDIFIEWVVHVWPIVIRFLRRFLSSSVVFIKKSSKKCISCIPGKDKLWFMVPVLCIVSDFVFLVSAMTTQILAKTTYFILMFHKLALLELLESNSAALCYSIIYFYPSLIRKVSDVIPIHDYDYAPGAIRWIFVQTYLLHPIRMKETYLYTIKSLITSSNESPKYRFIKRFLPSAMVRTKADTITIPPSDRVAMANYILSILRKIAPFVVILEVYIHRDGFLMYLTSTERILLGYGLSVLRTGYLFSPLIWISWTIQLTIIMFISPRNFHILDHCLFILGLVSIRLSHYTAALEDLEGANAIHSNSTSPRRRMASHCANRRMNANRENS